MKNIVLSAALFLTCTVSNFAQINTNIGGGYFGHMGTHPGFVLEIEKEHTFSEKASIPVRIDLGCYVHKRNHNGLFVDINYGFRRYYKSGFFLEESIGFGVLFSTLNGDGVYEVDDNGVVSEVSSFNQPDLMPSVTLGIGYDLSRNSDSKNLVWLRPKLAWQFPHKLSSLYTPSVQLGYTHTIKNSN